MNIFFGLVAAVAGVIVGAIGATGASAAAQGDREAQRLSGPIAFFFVLAIALLSGAVWAFAGAPR